MAHSQPIIRSGVLTEFKSYLTDRGIDYEALASSAGLSPLGQEGPLQQFPLNAAMALFDLAATALKDPALGIHFASSLRPGGTGLIGEIILNAPTVRVGLASAANFIRVFMSPFQISFTEDAGIGRFDWSFPTAATAPRVQYNLFIVAALTLRVRAATGHDWVPLAVELEHVAPACPEVVRTMLGSRVRFDAGRNRMTFDGPTLARVMPSANATRFAIMRDLASRWLAELSNQPGIVAEARSAIASLLKAGQPDLETVAGKLGITAGALQWRLERADTTFAKVLTDERRSQAESLLRDTDRPLTEIAYDLGFSDPSAFTRAARRWFDMTPRAWRRSQRQLRS